MRFEWDHHKNEINIHKHKIDFTDAVDAFLKPMLIDLDIRKEYGEDRWVVSA